ncbi:hypothetical protein [Variovorax guangxiensis]|uniref:Type II toxin-antitoxin system RelE/ParE family toxin n=1 Tax=Variovorax guangxiensis TaxID=1775474 RepID=A0A840GA78_9BURK|nr:hypothetical protein [Variovorax guangxiensis]MBB4226081.1 hypothetical protein [Variovorax guangxiensis]
MPSIGLPVRQEWSFATPVRDNTVAFAQSKFFKSLKDECDDKSKKKSLLNMAVALKHAVQFGDYQSNLKNVSGIGVKEAFSFDYRNKRNIIWELKYQNKDRLYFFSQNTETVKLVVPLLFHHKKDQNTPQAISNYCKDAMKDFLDPSAHIKVL